MTVVTSTRSGDGVQHPVRGLHHVTATVDRALPDLVFCERWLGLRLVKRTVNFDNHGVYHFYYGTESGAPGTIWTTFPYHGWGVPAGVHGAGQIAATAFSIPGGTVDFWRGRLAQAGVGISEIAPRFGRQALALRDPSGLLLELVEDELDARPPWAGGGVALEAAIRGLHSVTLLVRSHKATVELMTGLLGFTAAEESAGRLRLAAGATGAGHLVDLIEAPDAPPARNGLGTVHHVAFAVAGADEQLRLRRELLRAGREVTEVRDRTYFRSIYFREPGGVLFEIATMAPGFTLDEPLDALGRALRLPPWEEPHRAEIERMLPALVVPGPLAD